MVTPLITLDVGQIEVSREPTVISTVLGSCVSVCVFDPASGVGGMIHFALPDQGCANGSLRNELHFGGTAVRKLVEKVTQLSRAEPKNLCAKIVGGAAVIDALASSAEIGSLNVAAAERALAELGVRIVASRTGGKARYKVYFYTDSGRLRIAHLNSTYSTSIPNPIKEKMAGPTPKKVRVLVIDDSKTMRDLLGKILNAPDIEVVGSAEGPRQAEPLIKKLKPDVITLDIHMPEMNGVEFLKKFLPVYRIPTVMVTSVSLQEGDWALKALELGAVDYIQKPTFSEIQQQAESIREKVLIASSIKVKLPSGNLSTTSRNRQKLKTGSDQRVIGIGASTGGTEALKEVLVGLPDNIPPVLIVQHIPPVFSTAFARRLNDLCAFEVKEAADGDKVIPGRVLIAPGDRQMEVEKRGSELKVRVFEGEKINRHRPSVDVLFSSMSKVLGRDTLGVILTGMGNDGAKGLLELRQAGAHTIGQDESSCVVYGMPKAAAELGAVAQVVPLPSVAMAIFESLNKTKAA